MSNTPGTTASGTPEWPLILNMPSPPPEVRVAVRLGSQDELADLVSIFSDLLVAGMAAHHVNDPVIQEPGFLYLRRACWEGAIISYSRCFGGGQGFGGRTRHRIADYLSRLSDGQRQSHERILRLRDKAIGHQVAREGDQQFACYVGLEPQSADFIAITDVFLHLEIDLYDTGLLRELEEISETLRGHVGQRIDELRAELLSTATTDGPRVVQALRDGRPWSPK